MRKKYLFLNDSEVKQNLVFNISARPPFVVYFTPDQDRIKFEHQTIKGLRCIVYLRLLCAESNSLTCLSKIEIKIIYTIYLNYGYLFNQWRVLLRSYTIK